MKTLIGHICIAILALALGWGGIAHANEAPLMNGVAPCASGTCSETVQSDAEGSSDHENSAPCAIHAHGGCHGHHQMDAVKLSGVALREIAALSPHQTNMHFGVLDLTLADLRPPIA